MKYSEVPQSEIFKGVKSWRNPGNNFRVAMVHYTADPDKDPDREGLKWYRNERKGVPKADWEKEYEIDSSTKSGKLIFGPDFCDMRDDVHFIPSFKITEPVEYLMSLDFGQRNPTAALIGAWTRKGELYIIDEYYRPALPSVSSSEMFEKFAYLFSEPLLGKTIDQKRNLANDLFQIKVIDPTTKSQNRSKVQDGEEVEYSVLEEFYDNGWEFELGNNDVTTGITRIREYFRISPEGHTRIKIFQDKCPKLYQELKNYRYKEISDAQSRDKNDSEEPVKKNDHAIDSARYMVMTRPATPTEPEKPKTKIQKHIESLIKPKAVGIFDDDSNL